MNRGYVKLWRKSIEGGWLTNHKLWAFWCWCLLKASHKECDVIVGYKQVHLVPGEFIFGRKAASKELGISERSIRTNLDFLKTTQNLTIKTTNKYSIISIVNWSTYQQDIEQNDHQNDQQVTSKRPANDQQVTTNKNVKNVKNNKTYVFVKPSLEEVRLYCHEKKYGVNPEAWMDFYESNGWKVGKNPMKDWKAAIRTWARNNYGEPVKAASSW